MKTRWRKGLNVKKILKVQGKHIGKNFNAEIEKVFLNLPQNPEVIKIC